LERSTSPDRGARSAEPTCSVRSWAGVTGPPHVGP
jgi:hypothetical protein